MKSDVIGVLVTSGTLFLLFLSSIPRSAISPSKSMVPKSKPIRVNEKQMNFLKRMRGIQYERKQTIKNVCRKYKTDIGYTDVYTKPPWNIAINDEYRLLYCFTPKVASTSWKRVLLVLNGFMNTTDEQSQLVVNRAGMNSFQYLDGQSPKKIKFILSTYTKFMFTRDPFSRILSAFRNKLAPDTDYNQSGIWRQRLGYYLNSLYRNQTKGDKVYDLTFAEFVRYLIDPNETDHKHWKNPHWGYQYERCRPCEIDYDVVGKFESLEEDAQYIMKIVGIANVTSFPSSSGSNPTNSSKSNSLQTYYSELPRAYVRSLYQRFKIDFEMFGYKNLP